MIFLDIFLSIKTTMCSV